MTLEFRDLDDGIGNVLICSGVFTSKEYIIALKKHLSQHRRKFKEYKYNLTDLSEVTKVTEWSAEDIHLSATLCEQAAKINQDAIVAILVNQTLTYGLARMWENLMINAGWETMVFQNRTEAELWLKERVKEKFNIEDLTMM